MPAATKRRKVGATTVRSLTAPAAQRSIQAFGRISKPQIQDSEKGKNGIVTHGKDVYTSESRKKRKFQSVVSPTDDEEAEKESSPGEQALPLIQGSSRPVEGSVESLSASAQDETPRKEATLRSHSVDTPTKGARSWLESVALDSSSPISHTRSSSPTTHNDTPPSSPISTESEPYQYPESDQLPDELQELVSLHSSFLTALSLYYAHNGSMASADLRTLRSGVERLWRKRRVTTDDVRRILAIRWPNGPKGDKNVGPLCLLDYGHGKICIEIVDNPHSRTATRRPINEDALNTIFLRDLEQRWTCYKTKNHADPSPSNFLASLPLLPVTPCTSLSKLHPLLSKGQRRLEDLKAGAIKAQQKPLSITSANSTNNPPQPQAKQPITRSIDLFSRLKAKQLHQSTLPLPPSAEALARKSALQRLKEITPVLESLVSSSKKHANDDAASLVGGRTMTSPVSFTMPTLVQHLQMSLRNPISKEEVIKCVRELADMVPDWVGLKEVGKVLAVTIKGQGMRKHELERKVETLLEKL